MPSSLLIYWTINNLFLFIRTLSKTFMSFSFNKRFLDEKLLFIYLIPLLDVIHYWSKDTSSFVFLDFFYFLTIIIGVIFISLRILKKVTKEYERLGFFLAISILFFLNISAYHSNLSEILFNRKLALILLVLIYLSVSLIPYFFYNLMTNFPSSKLNVFFLTLILIYLVSGSLNANKNFKYDNSISPKIERQLDTINQEEKDGDIILIVLDAYGNEQTLKNYYEHDNSNFIKKLDSFGFTTISKSFSNYSQTHLSLASMLNFTYLNNYEGIPKKGKSGKLTQKLLSDNKVGKILKKLGYNYIHFNSGWGGNISSENAENNIDTYLKTIPISRNFNTYLLKSFIPKIYEFTIPKSEAEMEKLKHLEKIAMNNSKDFVFMHMMLPHPPYVFNEEGEVEVFENSEHFGGVWLDKDAYINQLKFLNKKLIELFNKILNKSDIKPAFIIVSDHGPYISNPFETNNNQQNLIKNRMQNFTSIFLPNLDKTKSDLNIKTTSLINIFPIFFREYFGINFKLSEDKLFYSSYLEPYKFSEVKN